MNSKLKLMDVVSTMGAGVLGFGLGAYFSPIAPPDVTLIILAGLALHSVGMYFKHRMENEVAASDAVLQKSPPLWVSLLYWFCWLLLVVLLAYLWVKKQG